MVHRLIGPFAGLYRMHYARQYVIAFTERQTSAVLYFQKTLGLTRHNDSAKADDRCLAKETRRSFLEPAPLTNLATQFNSPSPICYVLSSTA